VYAAGNRDDLLGRELGYTQAQDSRAIIHALTSQPATVDLRLASSTATSTFESDIARVLALLVAVRVERVIVVDLTPEWFRDELSVVRAVVPGLAGPGVENGLPSKRAETMAHRLAA
jgi:ribosomal protein S12 methylthiotransferase accessory factor YcaO